MKKQSVSPHGRPNSVTAKIIKAKNIWLVLLENKSNFIHPKSSIFNALQI